ncbi:MAG: ABC-2 family transporter protein [Planctomycetales bacterium]
MTTVRPNYLRVWLTFFRNSLVREMTFRGNFAITVVTQAFWFAAQVVLFEIIYSNVRAINDWTREEYFAFMATGMLINAVVQAFFMPNCANFSELIRKGDLDFALLKPIDTQFLISFEKVEVAMLNQVLLAAGLLAYALSRPEMSARVAAIGPMDVAMYVLLLAVGVAFFYSLMIALASTSIWFGRNQGLYDFWFYVTVFARYPQNIYGGSTAGMALYYVFSYVLPILLVVTVPARVLLQKALEPGWLTAVLIASSLAGLAISRGIFHWSLRHYRSASS